MKKSNLKGNILCELCDFIYRTFLNRQNYRVKETIASCWRLVLVEVRKSVWLLSGLTQEIPTRHRTLLCLVCGDAPIN